MKKIESIGFVGLGAMGAPQSANLIAKASLPVAVFDVDPSKVEQAVAAGATAAHSLTELAAGADVIFMSLPGEAQVRQVALGPDGLISGLTAGTVVVDLSTIPVRVAQELSSRLAEADVRYCDAPVAKTREAAVDGTLSIMVGCDDPALFEALTPLLGCMATEITRCGRVGAGALVKLVNNTIVFETVVALAEALTVVRTSGLVADDLLFDVLSKSSPDSFALRNHGIKRMLPDVHPEGLFSSTYMLKDLTYMLESAQTLGVSLPAAELARGLLEQACQLGYQNNYHTSVVRVIESGEQK